jgi:hypothetical protein
LNLFFQKDLARNWTAFVNFEFLNNFSSSRRWGSANLEEAWAKFAPNEEFNLKIGLQIPVFNNLNEIKNRTPLLPYIIRPLVYETSFSEIIPVEEFLPARAYAQVYGFIPFGEVKLDYALYIGNSPNISTPLPDSLSSVQTGIDTSATYLGGGRIGIRFKELKIGISATRDNVNFFQGIEAFIGGSPSRFDEVPRLRYGADLSYNLGPAVFEGEVISVIYDDDIPEASLDKIFYYATLGYRITEQFYGYGSYWFTRQDFTGVFNGTNTLSSGVADIKVPTIGFAYNLNDRITVKGQYAPVRIVTKIPSLQFTEKGKFHFFSAAISIFF